MNTQLAVKTDQKIKEAAQKKAADEGVTLTIVVNTFLKKYAEGDFKIELINTSDSDVTIDELFQSIKIVKEANKISNYLINNDL